jgi:small subunit ribosomal protein S16
MDARTPRDGRVIEELGYYDPMVRETDARAILNGERIDYWLGVGAQPSEKVRVLIRKYGSGGTHLEAQRVALDKLRLRPQAPPPVSITVPPKKSPAAADEPDAGEPAVEGARPTSDE